METRFRLVCGWLTTTYRWCHARELFEAKPQYLVPQAGDLGGASFKVAFRTARGDALNPNITRSPAIHCRPPQGILARVLVHLRQRVYLCCSSASSRHQPRRDHRVPLLAYRPRGASAGRTAGNSSSWGLRWLVRHPWLGNAYCRCRITTTA